MMKCYDLSECCLGVRAVRAVRAGCCVASAGVRFFALRGWGVHIADVRRNVRSFPGSVWF